MSGPRSNTCRNCGSPDVQEFCPRCGQENIPSVLPLKELLKDFLEEVFRFDTRIWVTFKALVLQPGFLTREYLAGRRMRYVSPLKLYIAVSFFYFLLFAFLPHGSSHEALSRQRSGYESGYNRAMTWFTPSSRRTEALLAPPSAAEPKAKKEAKAPDDTAKRRAWEREYDRKNWLSGNLSTINLLRLPVYALLLAWLFRKQKRYYIEHLIFLLHVQSVMLLVESASALLGTVLPLTEAIAWLTTLIYFFRAAKFVYLRPPGEIVVVLAAFFALSVAIDNAAGLVAGCVYLLQAG